MKTTLCVCVSALVLVAAAPRDLTMSKSPVADAVMDGDGETAKELLRQGLDVNAAQGDGTTALHWSAARNDVETARMLLYAGANVKATTRLGGYTPLVLASQYGHAEMVELLLGAGAAADGTTTTGATPLMFAASAGSAGAVEKLLDAGAEVNATEADKAQTPLMFAAARGRVDAMEVLLARGADVSMATKRVDIPEKERAFRDSLRKKAERIRKEREAAANADGETDAKPDAPAQNDGKSFFAKMFGWLPGVGDAPKAPGQPPQRRRRRTSLGQLVGIQGGLTPLLLAARQGHAEAARVLLDAGADINQVSEGNNTSPLLIAAMNGHYDLAHELLERGADPTIANVPANVTPLYAVINNWYAPKTSHPQPTAQKQQMLSHVELMKALLDRGADPNVRLEKKIWFSAYNFDQSGIDETGATPFWRAAYGSDAEVMRLLVAYGADATIRTKKPPERPRIADEDARELKDVSGVPPVPEGGPALTPLHAATGAGYGEGFASNEHRNHPAGWMPAVRYLVEELGADVNARDHEGSTPLHNAAARGDVEMIEFLVQHGADPTLLNREGQSTADMANGPVQRIQPFPEALELLVSLGAVNHDKCVSC